MGSCVGNNNITNASIGGSSIPGGAGGAEEEFCLRWNDFRDSIASSLLELRREKEFLDVSLLLSETDTVVMAHRVVLSACSSFFRSLLQNKNLGPHPVIVLTDVSPEDLDSVLSFMYNGEVKVRQDDLNSFLNVAEKLRVRGLCQGDKRASTSNKTQQQTHQRRRPSNNSSPPPPLKRPKTELQEEQDDEVVSNDGEDELVIDDRVDNDDDEVISSERGSTPNSQHSLHNHVSSGLKEDRQNKGGSDGGPPDDPSEEYSEYGYAPDEGYNDKTIPPPVVGMMLGDRMESLMDANNMKSGPWNSPNSGSSLNRSLHRLSSSDSFGGRRPRSVYTTQQLTQLEAYFKFNEYIDGDRKKQLSIITQIPEQQIKVWFQNRRQKKKRELEELQQQNASASNFHSPLLETKQHS